ncbi:MAG: hypothetical protein ABIL09_02900, partial [Gemmatimonadota bacterium]
DRLKADIDQIEEDDWKADEELLSWKLTFDILEKAFGIRPAVAFDTQVNPEILRARQIIGDPEEYSSWFRRPEIGVPDSSAIAAAADTAAAGVGGRSAPASLNIGSMH